MKRFPTQICLAFLASVLFTASAFAAVYEAIEIVPTRPDVSVRMLVIKANPKPSTALMIFPGGDGAKQFGEKEGRFFVSKQFLMRSARELAGLGFAVVAVDSPSDQKFGMTDRFRKSPEHLADVRKIIAYLKEKHRVTSLYLVGADKGTISALNSASVLDDPAIGGVILATVSASADYRGVDMEDVDYPVLILHHVNDECRLTPFSSALKLKTEMTESPRVDLVEVTVVKQPSMGNCDPQSNHGFYGAESAVLRVMADWIAGKPIPAKITK